MVLWVSETYGECPYDPAIPNRRPTNRALSHPLSAQPEYIAGDCWERLSCFPSDSRVLSPWKYSPVKTRAHERRLLSRGNPATVLSARNRLKIGGRHTAGYSQCNRMRRRCNAETKAPAMTGVWMSDMWHQLLCQHHLSRLDMLTSSEAVEVHTAR
jgi:hypothetical protein